MLVPFVVKGGILGLIKLFWVLVNAVLSFSWLNFNSSVNAITDFYNTAKSSISIVKQLLGIFYFFVPQQYFIPFLTFAFALLFIRCAFAIIQFIWW